ncbi:MAG: glycosyltransferase [Deltaproteobacteria bacterium]|jgi:hypothetical protein|nr:glycosyltransferase [Deltaproteobacteria bacterium]
MPEDPSLIAKAREALLATGDRAAARWLLKSEGEPAVTVFRAADGSEAIVAGGILQDSRAAPLAAASGLLDRELPAGRFSDVALFGLGSPALAGLLLERAGRVTAFEPSASVARAFLSLRDRSGLILAGKLRLLCPWSLAEGAAAPLSPLLITHAPSRRRAPALYRKISELVRGRLPRKPPADETPRILIVPPFSGGTLSMGGFLRKAAWELGADGRLAAWPENLRAEAEALALSSSGKGSAFAGNGAVSAGKGTASKGKAASPAGKGSGAEGGGASPAGKGSGAEGGAASSAGKGSGAEGGAASSAGKGSGAEGEEASSAMGGSVPAWNESAPEAKASAPEAKASAPEAKASAPAAKASAPAAAMPPAWPPPGLFGRCAAFLVSAVRGFRPHLLLALAQAPLDLAGIAAVKDACPDACAAFWFAEDFRRFTYAASAAAAWDLFLHIQGPCMEAALRDWGVSRAAYLPACADADFFRPAEAPAPFRAQVSFMGAGYPNRIRILSALDRELRGRGFPREGFRVYGSGWDAAPEGLKERLFAGGRRISAEETALVYAGSGVNLNVHSGSGAGFDPASAFVNPRTFEIAAAGGFQLSDPRPLMEGLFAPEEVACAPSPEAFPDLVLDWLERPLERAEAGRRARERVLGSHLYRHRLKTVLRLAFGEDWEPAGGGWRKTGTRQEGCGEP